MLTQTELKRIWHYDPDAGFFTRLVAFANQTKIGDIANAHDGHGYILIGIAGKRYKAHRLAFLYMTGSFPANDVDHINGIRDDNRWVNLRDATQTINSQNLRKPRENNKSGYLGVFWHKASGKWGAAITINSKGIHLGLFTVKEEAAARYLEKKRELHLGCTI